jgi:large subunit ribosomal protein L25
METVELKAAMRTRCGKKGAKQCRNEGMLPGILYGKGEESIPVAVDPKQLDHVLHTHAGSNVIIRLTVDDKGSDPMNVVVKELQVDSIKGSMQHVDFCQISLDEEIRSMVPFKVVGEAPGVKEGGILERVLWELEIESLPLNIPDAIEVDVTNLEIGDSLAVNQLNVPEGVTVVTDWDSTVISIAAPRVEEVIEEEAEVEIEGAEPELITTESEKDTESAEEKAEGKASQE